MTHFDLAIIGTGSGNSLVTPDFDDKRVAIIEEGLFGGTCLNVGCIPTKMFVYAAEVAGTIRESARYGVDSTLNGVRWRDIRDRIFGRIDPIESGGREYRENGPNTTAYEGHAEFVGPRELQVQVRDRVETVTADQLVIATGGHSFVPEVVSQSDAPFHTSDTIMRIDELPASMVILGGGFIAAEFAHIFGALGVDVHIVNRGPRLLRKEDEQISRDFTELARQQWDVHLNANVVDVKESAGDVVLALDSGETVSAELLLVATGRRASTERLGLEKADVATHSDGRVRVDEFGRTTADGVWSLGDVSSPYQLKHVANEEARVVAHNLVHPDDLQAFDHRFVPSAVFTHPQIASVGMTESAAREAGIDVTVKVQKYGDTAYGWAMEDTTSIFKVIADRQTRLIVGAHVMGPMSSSLIQPVIQAMSLGQTAPQVARGQYWIHPALAEVVENALLGLEFD